MGVIHNMHSPYYYCLSLSLKIPLKVGPGDDAIHSTSRAR